MGKGALAQSWKAAASQETYTQPSKKDGPLRVNWLLAAHAIFRRSRRIDSRVLGLPLGIQMLQSFQLQGALAPLTCWGSAFTPTPVIGFLCTLAINHKLKYNIIYFQAPAPFSMDAYHFIYVSLCSFFSSVHPLFFYEVPHAWLGQSTRGVAGAGPALLHAWRRHRLMLSSCTFHHSHARECVRACVRVCVLQGDDREFPSTTRTLQKSGNLTIARLTADDHGRYECVARNVIADVITTTFIIIEGLRRRHLPSRPFPFPAPRLSPHKNSRNSSVGVGIDLLRILEANPLFRPALRL